ILSHTKGPHLKILDLGCGPGLYAEKLSKYGHEVTGIDFSSSSIDYARSTTQKNNSSIEYLCQNYLNLEYKDKFDLVILIYLDFCVLKPQERKTFLDGVHR